MQVQTAPATPLLLPVRHPVNTTKRCPFQPATPSSTLRTLSMSMSASSSEHNQEVSFPTRNTFIHFEDSEHVDERIIQSMPRNMFRNSVHAEALQRNTFIHFEDSEHVDERI